jgi:hypothetical protein
VQGDRRLATAAAYEVGAEPRPAQAVDTKRRAATGRQASRIAAPGASAAQVPGSHAALSCPASLSWGLVAVAAQSSAASEQRHPAHGPGRTGGKRPGMERSRAKTTDSEGAVRGRRGRSITIALTWKAGRDYGNSMQEGGRKIKADRWQPARPLRQKWCPGHWDRALAVGEKLCVLGLLPGSARQQRVWRHGGLHWFSPAACGTRRQWAMCGCVVPPHCGVVMPQHQHQHGEVPAVSVCRKGHAAAAISQPALIKPGRPGEAKQPSRPAWRVTACSHCRK